MAEQRNQNYEPSVPPVKPVVTIGVAFAVTFISMAFVSIGVMVLFTKLDGGEPPSARPLAEQWQLQPAPQLVTTEGVLLASLRAAEEVKLNTYAWIDQPAGIARIPIEAAMELVLADLRVRGAAPPAVTAPPADLGAPANPEDPTSAGAAGASDPTDSASGAADSAAAGETNPAGDSEAPNR
jgi:hypothetical protein